MSTLEYMQQGHWIAALSIMSFSFFAGWSIGFALKTVMKIILLIAGLIIGSIIVLQYVEIIPAVNWERVSELFQAATASIKAEGSSIFDFASGKLPAAASFGIGLWFALRRF